VRELDDAPARLDGVNGLEASVAPILEKHEVGGPVAGLEVDQDRPARMKPGKVFHLLSVVNESEGAAGELLIPISTAGTGSRFGPRLTPGSCASSLCSCLAKGVAMTTRSDFTVIES
jgi:hypothetical protein